MKDNKEWYWEQTQQQNQIIVPKRTIVHLCVDVLGVPEVKKMPKSVHNRNQARKAIQVVSCMSN